MITPPVGLNLFIISAMSRDVPIRETYKGDRAFRHRRPLPDRASDRLSDHIDLPGVKMRST